MYKQNDQKNNKSPYYYLSAYRSHLMGFAILWVVWFHSRVYLNFFSVSLLNNFFSFVKTIGYGGVDVFLLVSGMGIYNSLEKNEISKYIRNRIKRIMPVWWTYLIICILLGHFVFNINFSKMEIIGFATYTGYWLDMSNQGNWYVYAIILFYLISPIFYSLLKNSKNKLTMVTLLVTIAIIVSVAFWESSKLIVFSRVPIYIIGMYVFTLKDFSISKKHWFGMLAFFIFGIALLFVFIVYFYDYLWSYGLWWYPFITLAPTLSLLVTKGFDIMHKRFNYLLSVLSILGKSSLEILLVSDAMFNNFKNINITIVSENLTNLFIVLISIIVGILFHFLLDFIIMQQEVILKRQSG